MPTLCAVSGSIKRIAGARYSKSLNCAALLCSSSRRNAYAPADAAAVPSNAANLGGPEWDEEDGEDDRARSASGRVEARPRRDDACPGANPMRVTLAARARAPPRASAAVGDIGGAVEGARPLQRFWPRRRGERPASLLLFGCKKVPFAAFAARTGYVLTPGRPGPRARVMRGSDARRKPAVTQPISGYGYGYGAASRARRGGEGEAASSPGDENVALEMSRDERWTKQLCASTATRVLLAMALFGIIGTLLPVVAMRLGVRIPQVAKTGPRRHAFTAVGLGDGRDHARGVSVSTSGAFSGRGVAGLGAYGGETSLIGTPLKPCSGPDQAEATGWDRSGSCAWDPTDSGYHEVRSTPTNLTETPVVISA